LKAKDFRVGDKVKAMNKRVKATYGKVGEIQRIYEDNTLALVRFEGKDPVYGDFPFERVISLKHLTKISNQNF